MPVLQLPIDFYALAAGETIVEEKLLVPATMFVHQSRYFHVEAAILGDLDESAFAPPFDCIEARRGFTHA
jgi:hypothetical protein